MDSAIAVGDIFNETDDDQVQQVMEIRNTEQTVLCRSQKKGDESSETEQEYDMEYVKQCVMTRKQWMAKGYDHLDVYAIYRMTKKTLISVLKLAKQSTKGNKQELRYRLVSFRQVCEIPSDVEDESEPPDLEEIVPDSSLSSDDDDDDDAPTVPSSRKRKAKACAKPKKKKSAVKKKDKPKKKKSIDKQKGADSDSSDTADDADKSSDSDYSPSCSKKSRNKKQTTRSRKKSVTPSVAAASTTTIITENLSSAGDVLATKQLATSRASTKNGSKKKRDTGTRSKDARESTTKKNVKSRKHQAVWKRERLSVTPVPRHLPEHAWRHGLPRRSNFSTPWNTWRKVFFTDEMVDFALTEFNHYPKTLASMRTRPPYVPKGKEWPPKWVNETGRGGPMHLNKHQYLKYICILYLLGVKNLNNTSLDDLFSANPIMRENWLCEITTRRDLGRFLRQVRP